MGYTSKYAQDSLASNGVSDDKKKNKKKESTASSKGRNTKRKIYKKF